MKKILIILCAILLVGCSDNKDKEYDEKKEEVYNDIRTSLWNYAVKVYEDKIYEGYSMKNDKYFISIGELESDLDYDISMFKNELGEPCDTSETGIYVDIDNVEDIVYDEYPILISIYCD